MGERDTVLRSMHDTGLAAWFGGSLMGAVGLNGAAAKVEKPDERLAVSSMGWRRWTPVNFAAIGAHLLGASGILASERRRVAGQRGVAAMSVAKTGLTVAALGATGYAGVLGMKLNKAGRVPVGGPTESTDNTPMEVRAIQHRQRIVQWTVPALTGALVAVSALAGEQQKPRSVMRGVLGRMTGMGKLGSMGKFGSMGRMGRMKSMGRMGSMGPMRAMKNMGPMRAMKGMGPMAAMGKLGRLGGMGKRGDARKPAMMAMMGKFLQMK